MFSRFSEFRNTRMKSNRSRLSAEERAEMRTIMNAASDTFKLLQSGNAPFVFFIDLFDDIIANHFIMFEMIKASEEERAVIKENYELEKLCKENFTKVLEIERLAERYENEGLSITCQGTLEFIRSTVDKLDAFNIDTYLARIIDVRKRMATTSTETAFRIGGACETETQRKCVKKFVSTSSEFLNTFEKERLDKHFYKRFSNIYTRLTNLMEELKGNHLPDGVVFTVDELRGLKGELRELRDDQSAPEKQLALSHQIENLEAQVIRDFGNRGILVDRAVMGEHVRACVAKEYLGEENFQTLFRELVEIIPSTGEEITAVNSEEVKELKKAIIRDSRKLTEALKELGGPFYFMIEAIHSILAKVMDLIICLDLFTKKFVATEQKSREQIMDRPEQVESNKRLEQSVIKIKIVVATLQELLYWKINAMQDKLESIKNVRYGGAYNAVVDFFRLRIHKLDCTNDRRKYKTSKYKCLIGKTSEDHWITKRNEATRYLRSEFRYNGPTALSDLPHGEREFVEKQAKLFRDKTYAKAMEAMLSLCVSATNLRVELKCKMTDITTCTVPEVNEGAAAASAAAAASTSTDNA